MVVKIACKPWNGGCERWEKACSASRANLRPLRYFNRNWQTGLALSLLLGSELAVAANQDSMPYKQGDCILAIEPSYWFNRYARIESYSSIESYQDKKVDRPGLGVTPIHEALGAPVASYS